MTRILCLLALLSLTGTSPGADANNRVASSNLLQSATIGLIPGKTIIPKPTGPALASHARVCSNLCAALPRISFESAAYTNAQNPGEFLRYRLFKPSCAPGRSYPITVCLHGGGATRNFDDLLKCASPIFAFGPARFASPEEQARHPAFVLVPWSGGRGWEEGNLRLIVALIDSLRRQLPIDPKRIYVTGQSMGGYGTWQMITRYPTFFAAGIPVCGGGVPAQAAKAKDVPVWAFHGSADGLVPVSETRRMIDALLRAGGRPIYWEYEGGTHAVTAERAYCEPGLVDWLCAQARP